jgi:ribonuclease G
MTRKRTRESLTQILCAPCRDCGGRGLVKSTETIAHEVLRRVQREAALNPNVVQIMVQVHPAVAQFLDHEEDRSVRSLESLLGKKIVVKPLPEFEANQYEVIAVEAAA